MQRVAIARALVNDPEILLADEPTGALDSHTSVQIMDLLKEIAKDRLVIMVTHNPELAQSYSTRIIRLKDGEIVSDSDPAADEEEVQNARGSLKKPSMKFRTALSLSFNNLLTKKGRTLLTAFAGSIGIIGIGLIMSLSNGMQGYIDRVEQDTMTSYPISIEDNTMDMSVLMSAMMTGSDEEKQPYDGTVRSRAFADKLLGSIADTEKNNLTAFRKYLQSPEGKELKETASAIEYNYGITMHVYNEHAQGDKLVTVSPNGLMDELGMSDMISLRNQFMGGMSSSMPGSEVWKALPAEDSLRDQEYELLDGRWPESEEEVMLEVDENGEISDFTLYSLGLMNQSELVQNYKDLQAQKTDEIEPGDPVSFAADELLGMEFTLVPNSDLYRKVGDIWVDESGDEGFVADAVKEDGRTLKIAGIMKPKETSLGAPHTMGGVWYDRSLETWLRDEGKNSDIVREQMEHKDINVFTGRKFGDSTELSAADLTPEQQMVLASMSQQELMDYMASYNDAANATYDSNLAKLGIYDEDTPTSIELYADTFEDKEKIGDLITAYNEQQQAEGNDANVISYNDTVGAMMSGVSDIINIISYVLMAFVGISLVVSSIMIGIITYISVLERVKEIGILRAMGASKRDVSNVFNAETFIIGLLSGLLGVGLTVLLNIPISLVIQKVTGVAGIARMPVAGGAILVLVELVLTMVAGLIPARMAARKDPVQALRSE